MRALLPACLVTGLLLGAPSALLAQVIDPAKPTITVIGDGRAEAPADFAWLSFNVRGEGATSPEAVTALTTARRKLEASFKALPGKPVLEARDGTLSIREVRPKACQANYGAPNLSTGECAVIGSIATANVQVKVTPAKQVGDVASLAAQLGAAEVNVSSGGLVDNQPLEDKALRAAIVDAKRQAQLIAEASGRSLGSIVRIQDSQAAPVNAPPPPPPAPVYEAHEDIGVFANKLAAPLALTPPPITRTARVTVTYGLLP